MNWYNYVGSDPINFTDPTGLNREFTSCNNVDGTYVDSDGTIVVTFIRTCVGVTVNSGPFDLPAPSGGTGNSGNNKDDKNKKESEACKILREASDSASNSLDGWVKVPHTWNDANKLQFHKNTAIKNQSDSSKAGIALYGLGIATVSLPNFGLAGSTGVFVSGTAIGSIGIGTNSASESYAGRARAITARQNYLNSGVNNEHKNCWIN